jgi:hypothetical protein
MGCDSIYQNNFHQVVSLDTSIVLIHDTLKVNLNTNVNFRFQWKDCSNNTFIKNQTSSIFRPSNAGNYAVIVFDTINGCVDSSKCINISLGREMVLTIKNNYLHIYPNPVKESLVINCKYPELNREVSTIEVTDLLGRVMLSSEYSERASNQQINKSSTQQLQLDVSTLSNGIYFIKATDTLGNSLIGKFVKE